MLNFPGYEQWGPVADWATSMLVNYAGKAGEKVVSELGDRAVKGMADKLCAKATEVWGWIKGRLGGKGSADRLLQEFEQAPAEKKDALALLLEQRLEDDEAFGEELRPMLEELRSLRAQMPPRPNIQVAHADRGGVVIQQQGEGHSADAGR